MSNMLLLIEEDVMFKRFVLCIVGFGLGLIMILNSGLAFYRSVHGFRALEPLEWRFSGLVTLTVGAVLLIWTALLLRKKQ